MYPGENVNVSNLLGIDAGEEGGGAGKNGFCGAQQQGKKDVEILWVEEESLYAAATQG